MDFGAEGTWEEEAAAEVAQAGRAGKLCTEQESGILKETGIGCLGLGAGITDQGKTLADRTEGDGEDARTVDPAAEGHGRFVPAAREAFRAEQVGDLLGPDIQAGVFILRPGSPDSGGGHQDPNGKQQRQKQQQPEPGEGRRGGILLRFRIRIRILLRRRRRLVRRRRRGFRRGLG